MKSMRASACRGVKPLTDAMPSQAERLLEGETGDLLGGMSALWGNLQQEAGKFLRSRLKTAAGVLFVVLLCAVLGGLREGGGTVPDFVPMGGALAIAALTAGSLKNLVGLGWEAMEATSVFGKALLGALAVSLAAGGAVQTASLQQVGTVLFGTFLLELIRTLLLPLVYLYAATVTAAAIAPETPIRSLAEAIRKAVSWKLPQISRLARKPLVTRQFPDTASGIQARKSQKSYSIPRNIRNSLGIL